MKGLGFYTEVCWFESVAGCSVEMDVLNAEDKSKSHADLLEQKTFSYNLYYF